MCWDRIKIINGCDKIIIFSLYVIAYFLPISKAIIESATIIAIICYLIKKFTEWQDIPKTAINIPVFAYLIICIFSIFISSNAEISIRAFFFKFMKSLAFFFLVAETLNSERRVRNFLYILLVSSLLLGIDGVYQYFTHKDFIRHRTDLGIPRIYATFPTPNDFGSYLATVMPFILSAFFLKFRFKSVRLLIGTLFILIFTCLLLTVSRGAWFAFLASGLFMSAWLVSLRIFFLALLLFIAAAYPLCPPFLRERLHNFFVFADTSSIDRKIMWHTGWKMFKSGPLIGVGLGTFMFNFMKFTESGYRYGAPYAHNCYLQIAAETGIMGLASFLVILILFFYYGIRNLLINQRTFAWYVLLASLAAMLGYSIQMGVETIFYSLDLGRLFWLVLGLGVACMKIIETERAASEKRLTGETI